MSGLKRFARRLLAFLAPGRADREVSREIDAHLQLIEDDFLRRGYAPAEARAAARRSLGDLERAREQQRDARSFLWLDDAKRDVRYGLRALARDRGFTIVSVLTLALGIGGVTAMFGSVNTVLLRQLPFPAADRLVIAWEWIQEQRAGITAPDWLDWRRDARAFDGFAAYTSTTITLGGSGEPERLPARRVSAAYFKTLGVSPALGQDFAEADDAAGAAGKVLMSDALWRRRFAADRGVVGTSVIVNGEPRMVAGVLPPFVNLGEAQEQFYLPLVLTPAERAATGSHFLRVIGRLRPDSTSQQAQAELSAIAARLAEARPHSNREVGVKLEGLQETLVRDLRQPLWFFMGAVALLLVIVCANIATLQIVRTSARSREVAIRSAIGAGRGRLVRQFVIESLVVGLLGGAAGWLLATWSTGLMPWLVPTAEPRLHGSGLDWQVAGFTAALSVVAGLIFGIVPAWQVAKRDLRDVLSDVGHGSTGARRHRVASLFVVVETALALVLLVGAGLIIRSVSHLRAMDPGFRTDDVLAFRVSLPDARYGRPEQTIAFFDGTFERIRSMSGVRSVGATSALPLRTTGSSLVAPIEGRPKPVQIADFPRFFYRGVMPGYFKTLGIRVTQGRDISADDRTGRPRVGVINEAAAARYWPNSSPVGARIAPDDGGDAVEIVGVVSNTRHLGLGQDAAPELFIAVAQAPEPYWRWTQRTLDVVVHTAPGVDPSPSIRQAVRDVDPALPVYLIAPMATVVDDSIAAPRRTMVLVAACGAIALLLSALGMYGVIASAVRGRTQEIGVRMALGAARRNVLALVLGRSLRLCGIGLAIGAIAAISLRQVIGTFLFGVTSTDPATYVTVAGVLIVTAVLASLVPARRAMRIDPLRALRE